MKTLINMTNSSLDLKRFKDAAHLRQFYEEKGLDGLEVMFVENAPPLHTTLQGGKIVGVHLYFWPTWLDFYRQNTSILLKRHGSALAYEAYYGGKNRDALFNKLLNQLDFAQQLGAEYVVFHVCEIAPEDVYLTQRRHTDEEVILEACELINRLLCTKKYSFHFLCENLWWAGFNLEQPEMTRLLMDNIHYEKKGIMLDVGHWLHTNVELRTQEEAIQFLCDGYAKDPYLQHFIRGIHLHQTLSGAYVKQTRKNAAKGLPVFEHIFKVDAHLPFTDNRIANFVKQVSPAYLIHELISCDLAQHEMHLNTQMKTIKGDENGV